MSDNRPNKRSLFHNESLNFKRTFAHVDGNWSCHLYFPVKFDDCILNFAKFCVSSLQLSLLKSSILMEDNTHISLSKVFVLKAFQIDRFIQSLNNSIKACHLFKNKYVCYFLHTLVVLLLHYLVDLMLLLDYLSMYY